LLLSLKLPISRRPMALTVLIIRPVAGFLGGTAFRVSSYGFLIFATFSTTSSTSPLPATRARSVVELLVCLSVKRRQLSPVHVVECYKSNDSFDKVERCFDVVADVDGA